MEIKQRTEEAVKVLASFDKANLKIYFFSWRNRTYKVDTINMFHISRDGDKRYYHFAVSSGPNTYELMFDPGRLRWQLTEAVQGEGAAS
jgi:hypothetical protein